MTRSPPVTDASTSTRHDQLLDVAARQLNARGMSQRTLADLAGSLGFTRNALYHYVKDFEDLLSQVYRRSCILLGERLDEAMSQRDPSDILRAFVSTPRSRQHRRIAWDVVVRLATKQPRHRLEGLGFGQ